MCSQDGNELSGKFEPKRWNILSDKVSAKEMLHFGFGHGPRFCPGAWKVALVGNL